MDAWFIKTKLKSLLQLVLRHIMRNWLMPGSLFHSSRSQL